MGDHRLLWAPWQHLSEDQTRRHHLRGAVQVPGFRRCHALDRVGDRCNPGTCHDQGHPPHDSSWRLTESSSRRSGSVTGAVGGLVREGGAVVGANHVHAEVDQVCQRISTFPSVPLTRLL